MLLCALLSAAVVSADESQRPAAVGSSGGDPGEPKQLLEQNGPRSGPRPQPQPQSPPQSPPQPKLEGGANVRTTKNGTTGGGGGGDDDDDDDKDGANIQPPPTWVLLAGIPLLLASLLGALWIVRRVLFLAPPRGAHEPGALIKLVAYVAAMGIFDNLSFGFSAHLARYPLACAASGFVGQISLVVDVMLNACIACDVARTARQPLQHNSHRALPTYVRVSLLAALVSSVPLLPMGAYGVASNGLCWIKDDFRQSPTLLFLAGAPALGAWLTCVAVDVYLRVRRRCHPSRSRVQSRSVGSAAGASAGSRAGGAASSTRGRGWSAARRACIGALVGYLTGGVGQASGLVVAAIGAVVGVAIGCATGEHADRAVHRMSMFRLAFMLVWVPNIVLQLLPKGTRNVPLTAVAYFALCTKNSIDYVLWRRPVGRLQLVRRSGGGGCGGCGGCVGGCLEACNDAAGRALARAPLFGGGGARVDSDGLDLDSGAKMELGWSSVVTGNPCSDDAAARKMLAEAEEEAGQEPATPFQALADDDDSQHQRLSKLCD